MLTGNVVGCWLLLVVAGSGRRCFGLRSRVEVFVSTLEGELD